MDYPTWLTGLAIASLALAGICSLVIVADILAGHSQHMWIMNVVWPVTALYGGPVALLAYFRAGRKSTKKAMMAAKQHGTQHPGMQKPFWQSCAGATSHCGGGCTLGDIVAEWVLVVFPIYIFDRKIFNGWLLDFILAFLFGILFQYFTIQPMRHLSVKKGIIAALKADTLSLIAWQIGMYGWMAVATFLIFKHELSATSPVFWLMMQIAMWFGFATGFPVNWWLLKSGLKEKM